MTQDELRSAIVGETKFTAADKEWTVCDKCVSCKKVEGRRIETYYQDAVTGNSKPHVARKWFSITHIKLANE